MEIINYLSKAYSIDTSTVESFISSAPYKYKRYEIPKRNGKGNRVIAQPSKELKVFQRDVLINFFFGLPVHEAATAYRPGLDIKENATRHSANQYLLKMDFQNFFTSIIDTDLIKHISKHLTKLTASDRNTVKKLFFHSIKGTQRHWLSIGAPSSPFISNTIMFEFDQLIHRYSVNNDICYSRYADDLTFTTNTRHALFKVPDIVESTCKAVRYPKLSVNNDKTIFSSKKSNRHVTGIVLNNSDEISLGRKRKRYIKSLVHRYKLDQLQDHEISHLRGLISFASHIEPSFVTRLKTRYGEDLLWKLKQNN